jgi:hypothetical protein
MNAPNPQIAGGRRPQTAAERRQLRTWSPAWVNRTEIGFSLYVRKETPGRTRRRHMSATLLRRIGRVNHLTLISRPQVFRSVFLAGLLDGANVFFRISKKFLPRMVFVRLRCQYRFDFRGKLVICRNCEIH